MKRLFHYFDSFEMGSGQDLARQAGIEAASHVLGNDGLEGPLASTQGSLAVPPQG